MALIKCKECGENISNKAKFCPLCGAIPPKKTSRVTWLLILLCFLLVYGVSQTPALKLSDQKAKLINVSKEKQQQEKCKYLDEYLDGTLNINLYSSNPKWFSDNEDCLNPELKRKIENDLYSFIKKLPANLMTNNRDGYELLVILNPENPLYKKKFAKYDAELVKQHKEFEIKQAQIDKEIEIDQARAAKEQSLVKHRKERVEKQFSNWDGSHRNLERYIKSIMHDPDSYDHDNTVYWDKGGYLIVKTTYRGKNGFGGIVRNSIKAKVTIEGKIIEILN